MNTPRLWTKDFLIVSTVNFFVAINFYLLMVIISVFAMENFHSTPSEAGLASSIFVIGALIARLFSGRWIERIGRKKTLYVGLTSSLVMTLLYFGVNSVMLLFVIRFLHGAAFGISSTATGTVVANIIPKERRGEGIGYYMLSVSIAAAIGPFLAMFLSRHGDFTVIFITSAISGALSLVATFYLLVPEIQLTEEQLHEVKRLKLTGFLETKAIPISLVVPLFTSAIRLSLPSFQPMPKKFSWWGPPVSFISCFLQRS